MGCWERLMAGGQNATGTRQTAERRNSLLCGSRARVGTEKGFLGDGTYDGFKHPNHDVAKRLATDATERKLAGTITNNAQGTNTQCTDECQ